MLQLFGRPTLTTASGERVEILPTGWRLIAALAAGPAEGVARTKLASLVIPTGKLSTLRKLVWDVRKALDGKGLELLDGDSSVLRLSDPVYCDVWDLRALQPQRSFKEIYRGAFFETGSTFRHEPWTTWLAQQRKSLLELYVTRVADHLTSVDGDRTTRAQDARHLLKHVPDHAVATQVLMLEAARSSDAGQVRHRFEGYQASLKFNGGRPDQRTRDLFYRLVGSSQRQLGALPKPEVMDLPTIYVPPPSVNARSRAGRMVRSLLVDITIGFCRANMFRVIASAPNGRAEPSPTVQVRERSPKSYEVATSILDHVLGQQIVFTLSSLPEREILWTEKIDAAAKLTVAAYNLLTAGVLRSLVHRIHDLEVEAFRLDADPGAYALYLAGVSSLGSLDLAQLRKGRHQLERSMSQSIDFAPTASALARSYSMEWLVAGRGDGTLLSKAREYSLRAIASDPHEARGFNALGFCDLFEKKFDAALENYGKAEQLNGNFADLIADHANCLLHCGLPAESLEKIDYAMQLNPNGGDVYRWTKASTCFFLSRYDDALDIIDEVQDRDPVWRLLAATYAMLGNREEARRCRMKALEAYPAMTIKGWTNTIAMRDPQHIQHYVEGLALAGFE